MFTACVQAQVQTYFQPYFYYGLLNRGHENNEAARYFEKALGSPNVYIRQAAAAELGILMNEGMELSTQVFEQVRREASGSWAEAFNTLDNPSPNRQQILALLLNSSTPREVALYTLRESRNYNAEFFTEAENAAIEGRLAVSRSYFRGALRFFRTVLENEPQDISDGIFFQYPDLINDLGRAFQFACATPEGIELFLEWERDLRNRQDADLQRYRLLFFAGRIARQRGFVEQAIDHFVQALPLAPNSAQLNASIWYILDLAIRGEPWFFISKLEQFAPKLHDVTYLDVILDRFSRELILSRGWNNMIRTFQAIQNLENSLSVARYAWIIARVIEEGFLSEAEIELAAAAINASADDNLVRAYKYIVYNNGNLLQHIRSVSAAYYRSVSAAALGRPFLELPPPSCATPTPAARRRGRAQAASGPSPILEFFLGFFQNNAASFVPRYIRLMENQLSTDELRAVAQGLYDAGLYAYAMRITSSFTRREGHVLNRQDIVFLYPAPYRNLIEGFARQYNLDVPTFFGLIRTESAFLSAVASHAGAVGLSQLMPATAQEMANRIRRMGGPNYFFIENGRQTLDLTDPTMNVHVGAFYMNHLLQRFDNDMLLALFAYNGGQGRVRRWRAESTLPTDLFMETIPFRETREYGRRVLGAAAIYRVLYFLD